MPKRKEHMKESAFQENQFIRTYRKKYGTSTEPAITSHNTHKKKTRRRGKGKRSQEQGCMSWL